MMRHCMAGAPSEPTTVIAPIDPILLKVGSTGIHLVAMRLLTVNLTSIHMEECVNCTFGREIEFVTVLWTGKVFCLEQSPDFAMVSLMYNWMPWIKLTGGHYIFIVGSSQALNRSRRREDTCADIGACDGRYCVKDTGHCAQDLVETLSCSRHVVQGRYGWRQIDRKAREGLRSSTKSSELQ